MLAGSTQCIKTKPGFDNKQYCYVGSECAEGEPVETLKLKLCSPDHDELLSNMEFWDFIQYSNAHKLEKAELVKHVFPTYEGATLPEVKSFWLEPDAAPMTDALRLRLEAIRDSGNTTVFASEGTTPLGVAEGKKFYWINEGDMASILAMMGPKKLMANKEKLNDAHCVAGCEEVVPVW